MKYYNSHVYNDGKLIAAGAITDRDGVVLVETKDGDRVYNDSKSIRKSNLHVVGDIREALSQPVFGLLMNPSLSAIMFLDRCLWH